MCRRTIPERPMPTGGWGRGGSRGLAAEEEGGPLLEASIFWRLAAAAAQSRWAVSYSGKEERDLARE